MTCLRSTTVLYSAYIKFSIFIGSRDVSISFLDSHLILDLTFLNFAVGIQGWVENVKLRFHRSLVCWEYVNFRVSYFKLFSLLYLP
jgi:hypothetical protein